MTAVNPWRGEVPVKLAGTEYRGRPDYTAIMSWEQATGRTSTELLVRFASGSFSLAELTAVLHAAVTSGGHPMPAAEVGGLIVEEGQTYCLEAAGRLLRNALTGGKDPRPGEAAAAAPENSRTAA